MSKLKMKFSYVENNMGDMLNILIPRDVFGVEIIHEGNPYTAESTGIGSYLNTFFMPETEYNRFSFIKKSGMSIFDKITNETRIWSTGFISYPTEKELSIRNKDKLTFSSVRGELSKKRIEKILDIKLDISTGDGGILVSEVIKPSKKKYELGIIPHFKEYGDEIYGEYAQKNNSTTIINLQEDPYKVLKDISECEYILSSSLHGLIVADSFGIPNSRIVTSDKLMGDGFKFDDYYSSFGVKSNKFIVKEVDSFPSINDIIDNYSITESDLSNKKKEVYEAFFKNISIKGKNKYD